MNAILAGEKDHNSLSYKGAQQVRHFLTQFSKLEPQRAPLSEDILGLLSSYEQVDVAKPLEAEKKNKIPSVHSAQNIWHQLIPSQRKSYAQNLQDTQAQGSRLIVGPTEACDPYLANLPDLLQRHGYIPDQEANIAMKTRTENNAALTYLRRPDVSNYVYLKEGL